MALLFLTSGVQALWSGYDGLHMATTEPMMMSLQEISRLTIVLSRKMRHVGEKFPGCTKSRVS
jgi:hypothetical protein